MVGTTSLLPNQLTHMIFSCIPKTEEMEEQVQDFKGETITWPGVKPGHVELLRTPRRDMSADSQEKAKRSIHCVFNSRTLYDAIMSGSFGIWA